MTHIVVRDGCAYATLTETKKLWDRVPHTSKKSREDQRRLQAPLLLTPVSRSGSGVGEERNRRGPWEKRSVSRN